jgi:hypothetical protein
MENIKQTFGSSQSELRLSRIDAERLTFLEPVAVSILIPQSFNYRCWKDCKWGRYSAGIYSKFQLVLVDRRC